MSDWCGIDAEKKIFKKFFLQILRFGHAICQSSKVRLFKMTYPYKSYIRKNVDCT